MLPWYQHCHPQGIVMATSPNDGVLVSGLPPTSVAYRPETKATGSYWQLSAGAKQGNTSGQLR